MTVAEPKPGTLTPAGGFVGSDAADCANCGGRIRTASKGGVRWWRHVRGGAVECPVTTHEGGPQGAGKGAAPEPPRDALGFPIVGEYARLARLREGGWTGGVDQDGRPGPADIGRAPESVRAGLRNAGYTGPLGDDGYPSDARGMPEYQLEPGGVYRRADYIPFRVLTIEPAGTGDIGDHDVMVAEEADGGFFRFVPVEPFLRELVTLYSPSHPDDPAAADVARIERQTPPGNTYRALGWTEDEVQDALLASRTGKCAFLISYGALGSQRELCGAECAKDWIFCSDHLEDVAEGDPRSADIDRFRAEPPSRLDPQTPADPPGSGTTTTKENRSMSTPTATVSTGGEVTGHETAQASIAALRTGIAAVASQAELTANGLQAAGIGGDTITALYTVLDALGTAGAAAKTAEDVYNRTQTPLAEATTAAGQNAAATTSFYSGR